MAISLNPGKFGKLVDFFGGIKDIKKGTIRVLYNLSFIDDPTRIFRAIRFEQRLHFKIDKQTEHFINNAIKLGVFDKIANQRVRDELILILSEEKPINAIRRMADLNVLLLIHNRLKFTSNMERLFNSIYEVTNWFRLLFMQLNVEYWIIYFMAVIKELKESEIREILTKFKFTRRHIDSILSAYVYFSPATKKLQSSRYLSPSNIYKLLNPLPPEVILFIMANTRNNFVRKKISLFLTHYKEQKPFISGNDLIALGIKPSKKFKNIMEEILYLKLDGKIKTKEDEIEFVKNLKPELLKEEVGQKVEE
ncbi:CCA tRNA nucleotidyltransferase [Candidatus Desantisbacteria bacterium]|nr:CCA tRNA nucleotidyltransferase [Candidatus Desantisbacteria bacterium]